MVRHHYRVPRSSSALLSPIFLSLSLNCGRCRILALDPMPGAAGNIRRAEALRHDAFQAELARMAKYDVPALGNVLVQLKSPRRLADQLGKRSLALLERGAAQVFAGQLEEIEGE